MGKATASAHVDTFAADKLPSPELWPVMDTTIPPLNEYPAQMNCAAELLDKMVERGFGDRPLFRFASGQRTYREFQRKVDAIAHALVRDVGVRPGNRVLLRGPNSEELSAVWFAVIKVGGICVTTMPLLRARELQYIIERAEVGFALCDYRFVTDLQAAVDASGMVCRKLLTFGGDGSTGIEALARAYTQPFSACPTAADDVALIAFTSGTTGKAKATMHFHRDVMAICDCFPQSVLRPDADDVFCGTPPLAFTFGLGGILLFPMRVGASTVMVEKASPEELAQVMSQHKVTVCFTSPTGYRAMIPFLEKYPVPALKKCVSAGETLPVATFTAWKEATGMSLIDGIGATEMLHIFISASEDDIRPGSTGKAIPGYQARVVDENGDELPPNTVGLLAVRGPTGCRYMDDAARQKEYVRAGWNYTGDAYLMDKDGYFWFQARADDMIISSGYNIAGPEVENALMTHPKVKECGVVGLPDAERGNIVKAFVVLRNPAEAGPALAKALQEHVKHEIAPYKYPRAIEFVEVLPRTETGKLQRFRLRQSVG